MGLRDNTANGRVRKGRSLLHQETRIFAHRSAALTWAKHREVALEDPSARKLPIDTLKIDQSFVHNLTSNNDDASIVIALITLGRSMHLRVVAEGIETRRQLTFLMEHNCPEPVAAYYAAVLRLDRHLCPCRLWITR
jgi:EAL domain